MEIIKKIAVIGVIASLNVFMISCGSDTADKNETSSESSIQQTEENAEAETSAEESSTKENKIEELLKSDSHDQADDFVISKDILVSYNGVDSHVVIPDGVKKIADGAFWSIDYIEAVDIPASVTQIGASAFWSCAGLKYINAEEGLKIIGDTAFWSCPSLKDVNLPESVTSISDNAFANCHALTIHSPKNSYADDYAFSKQISSDNVYAEYQENSNENVIRAAQYAYGEFTEFEIEDGITSIEATAFQYCKSLEKIDIPSSVETIGGDAFEYCKKLEFVNINEGCIEIADGAFEYCESLANVNIPASVQKIEDSSFNHCDDNLIIHTPKGSYAEQYAKANNIAYDNNI